MFSRSTTAITRIWHCNPVWFNNTLCFHRSENASWLVGSVSLWVVLQEVWKLPLAGLITADNGGGWGLLLRDQVNPQSPGSRWQPSLSRPRLTFIFLSRLHSLSLPVGSHQPPLCDAQGGILQLLSAYCLRTRAMHTRAHSQECPQCTQAWAHRANASSKASKQAGRAYSHSRCRKMLPQR